MKVTRTSRFSDRTRTLELDITQEQLDRYLRRELLLQDAFPQLPPEQREFIRSGITNEEWTLLFKEQI